CVFLSVYIISMAMTTNSSISVNPYHFRITVIPKTNLDVGLSSGKSIMCSKSAQFDAAHNLGRI
ncbi:MAG: hypothetical protein PVJ86_14080, partial [Phycisphaerales bacterium]